MATHTLSSEQLMESFLDWRGIDQEHACKGCGGSGTKAYGSTSTWRGGIGGQMITGGPCDRCWGSGDEYRHWPSHRQFEAMKRELERLKEATETKSQSRG